MKFRDRRRPTDFEVVLLTEAGQRSVPVLDVSRQGLRIRQDDELVLEPEDDVTIQIRERDYPSRVTWTKSGEAGIEFDLPIPQDVHDLIARASQKSQKKRRFLFG